MKRKQNKSSRYFQETNGLSDRKLNPNRYSTARFRNTYTTNPTREYKLGSPTIYRISQISSQ